MFAVQTPCIVENPACRNLQYSNTWFPIQIFLFLSPIFKYISYNLCSLPLSSYFLAFFPVIPLKTIQDTSIKWLFLNYSWLFAEFNNGWTFFLSPLKYSTAVTSLILKSVSFGHLSFLHCLGFFILTNKCEHITGWFLILHLLPQIYSTLSCSCHLCRWLWFTSYIPKLICRLYFRLYLINFKTKNQFYDLTF